MSVFVCTPLSLSLFFPLCSLCQHSPSYQSFNLPAFPTFCPSARQDPLPPPRTSHIHYRVALAQSALFPSVVLNYSVFLGQALVSSYCNDFLIICLYVMNEMEMYHHGQTGAGAVPDCRTIQGRWEQQQQNNASLQLKEPCLMFVW